MAASITLTPAPGLTVETSLSISLSGSGYSTILASTVSQPTFAKNIAYDEFGNPFLSVVQDGKGNVFFDGGFPKYYNNVWSPAYTSFGALTNQLKLLYNAMKWCAEGNVTASNKILIFGDALVGEPYALKDTGANGFVTTLTNVAALAGFSVTIVDLADFPYGSEMTAAYLSQFASVIFMSTSVIAWDTAKPRLAAATLANLSAYRQQGGGLIVITDHYVFQTLANQVSNPFGVSFSGSVDRNPVSVDMLVATYGMHPLWANMTGSVYAGGSEGIISIPVITPFNPATDRISLTGPGYKTVFLTISDTTGKVTTTAYSYAMNVPDPVQGTMPTTTSYKYLDLPFEIIRLNSTDTTGSMAVDDTLIGSFAKRTTGLTSKSYSYSYPKPVVTTNGETIQVGVSINIPVIYHKVYPITLTPVNITSMSPAERWASMRNNEMAAIGPKGKIVAKLKADQALSFVGVSQADCLRAVNNYYSTSYRTPTERTIVAGTQAPAGGPITFEFGYIGAPAVVPLGSVDSQSPIFGNQILTRFSNAIRRIGGARQLFVTFKRTDNAVQVSSNFSGRRIRAIDAQGAVVFDQNVSTAASGGVELASDGTTNGWTFVWNLPNTFIFDAGGSWRIQVL